MPRLWRSTSARLMLGYVVLFTTSSLVLVGFLWWRTTTNLVRQTDGLIAADAREITDQLHDFGLKYAVALIRERAAEAADGREIYLLLGPHSRRLAGNLSAWPLKEKDEPGWHEASVPRMGRSHPARLLQIALPNGMTLLVGRDIEDRAKVRALIVDALGWVAGTGLVLALGGGMLVRRAMLRRIGMINRAATAIVRGDLSQRVPTRDTGDAFDQLSQTINVMLQQIQQLIEGVRNTANAIAHDLRTPLTELRARLEEVLRRPPSMEAAVEEVHKAVCDIDRLIGVFNALLRLAEIDSGMRRSGFRRVELAEIVTEVADLYRPLVEEKGADFTVEAPAGHAVDGDPNLLAQAIGNLVDNAVKYTPRGSVIALRVGPAGNGGIEITVRDNGPGIAHNETVRVIERFYRSAPNGAITGMGLGLSLVDAVARLHDGTLTFADNQPGLIASLTLPAASRPSRPPDLASSEAGAGAIASPLRAQQV